MSLALNSLISSVKVSLANINIIATNRFLRTNVSFTPDKKITSQHYKRFTPNSNGLTWALSRFLYRDMFICVDQHKSSFRYSRQCIDSCMSAEGRYQVLNRVVFKCGSEDGGQSISSKSDSIKIRNVPRERSIYIPFQGSQRLAANLLRLLAFR